MSVIPFPSKNKEQVVNERAARINAMIQERFGVSAAEYYRSERTDEVQKKIDRTLRKETLQYASNHK